MRRFEGKVVVITGGAAGIGRTYAHRFAHEGAAIVVADVDVAAAEELVARLESDGGRGLARLTDHEIVWYKRPATLAVLVLGLTIVLHVIFW